MQNAAKKQNATFAAAFLFASLVVTPLSLKALGVSLNLSAGVEAWRHIAGIFADSHQPASAAEVLALNFAIEDSQRDAASPTAGPLLASTQPLDLQLTAEPGLRMGDQVWSDEPAAVPAPVCAKAMRRAPRVTPREWSVTTFAVAVAAKADAQAVARAEAAKALVIRREALHEVERSLATYRVELDQALRLTPGDFKVMVKVKPAVLPPPPAMTGCATRKVMSPEKVKQLRAAWSLSFDAVNESSEKSEL